MTIDSRTNRVAPSSMLSDQLQFRLDEIVAEANSTDEELAIAIATADGGPQHHRPQIQRPCPPRCPMTRNNSTRCGISSPRTRRTGFSARDHSIGNRAGMPWDPPDHLGKDHYNRLHLAELEDCAESDIDRIRSNIAELLTGHNVDDGILYALQSQLASATTQLGGYQALTARAESPVGRSTTSVCSTSSATAQSRSAIRTPPSATRSFSPAPGRDLSRCRSATTSPRLRMPPRCAAAGLTPDRCRGHDVDGLRPPDESQPGGLAGAGAAWRGPARYLRGRSAGIARRPSVDRHGGRPQLRIDGVRRAASGGHHLDADNVIAVGSPGMLVDRADRLSLDSGAHVYAMRAGNDVIGLSGVVTESTLGTEPTAPGFGATRLAADPGPARPARSAQRRRAQQLLVRWQ